MTGFIFSKELVKQASDNTKYVVCSVPTNLANWGSTDVVGNVMAVNQAETEVAFYFTRTNPLEGTSFVPGEGGFFEVDIDGRTALEAKLASMRVIYSPGTGALLGVSTDWVPFGDLNYLTVYAKGSDHDLNAYVQLIEQKLPKVIS